jgi:DNA-binding NarL/FixJ family response regulator
MGPPAVLLVAGDSGFLASAARLLAGAGLMVVGWAESEEDARTKTAQLRPDIVVVDLDAPAASPLMALLRPGDGRPGVVVIALTDDELTRGPALAAGADAVLAKSDFSVAGAASTSRWRRRPARC